MKEKSTLLIVASFPSKKNKVVGGIEKSSRVLIKSKYFQQFEIIQFDTSQISNPPLILLLDFSSYVLFRFI